MINHKFINVFRKVLIENIWAIFLVLFFITEAIGKIYYLSGGTTNSQKLIKLIVVILISYNLIINYKKKFNLFSILLLIICFILGQSIITKGFNSDIISLFVKYLFPILLFFYFNNRPIKNHNLKHLFKVYELIIIINSILVLVGFLFKSPIFETYKMTRFGYNGLLRTSSTSTYFYIISLFYFLFKYKAQFFTKWKSLFVFIVCFFVGTKSIYLGLASILLAFLFIKFKKTKQRYFVSILLLIGLSVLGYLLFFEFGDFNRIREKHGLLSSILSYRDQLFINKTLPNINENWNFLNYLIGGLNNINDRSQLDFIDIFHFWGIIGGVFYLFTYYKAYITFNLKYINLYFLVFLVFIIFFSGNFFVYATIPIYLLIIREKILQTNNEYSNK